MWAYFLIYSGIPFCLHPYRVGVSTPPTPSFQISSLLINCGSSSLKSLAGVDWMLSITYFNHNCGRCCFSCRCRKSCRTWLCRGRVLFAVKGEPLRLQRLRGGRGEKKELCALGGFTLRSLRLKEERRRLSVSMHTSPMVFRLMNFISGSLACCESCGLDL